MPKSKYRKTTTRKAYKAKPKRTRKLIRKR